MTGYQRDALNLWNVLSLESKEQVLLKELFVKLVLVAFIQVRLCYCNSVASRSSLVH